MESLVFIIIMFLVGGVLQSLGRKNRRAGRTADPDEVGDDFDDQLDRQTSDRPKDILEAIREAMEAARREQESGLPRPMPGSQKPPLQSPATARPSARTGGKPQTPSRPFQTGTKPVRQPPAESSDLFDEEARSLETEPEVKSLEVDQVRPERPLINRDLEGEELVQRRIEWAQAHASPLTPEDHRRFDARIRPATTPSPARPTPQAELAEARHAKLRQMVIWQEILGKPKSLRD